MVVVVVEDNIVVFDVNEDGVELDIFNEVCVVDVDADKEYVLFNVAAEDGAEVNVVGEEFSLSNVGVGDGLVELDVVVNAVKECVDIVGVVVVFALVEEDIDVVTGPG